MSNLRTINLKLFKTVASEAKLVFDFCSPVGHIAKINSIDHTNAAKCQHHSTPPRQASWKIIPALPAIMPSPCTGCCLTMHSDPPWTCFFPALWEQQHLAVISITGSSWERDNFISQQKCHWQCTLLLALPVGWRENNGWKLEKKKDWGGVKGKYSSSHTAGTTQTCTDHPELCCHLLTQELRMWKYCL